MVFVTRHDLGMYSIAGNVLRISYQIYCITILFERIYGLAT